MFLLLYEQDVKTMSCKKELENVEKRFEEKFLITNQVNKIFILSLKYVRVVFVNI